MRLISTLMPLLKKMIRNLEFLRFLIVGTINTVVGYMIYISLTFYFIYSIAYSISFVFGVLISYYLNTKFVFQEALSWKKLVRFPLVYVTQYLMGLMLMFLLIEKFSISLFVAPLLVVIITTPITFFISRWIIKPNSKRALECND